MKLIVDFCFYIKVKVSSPYNWPGRPRRGVDYSSTLSLTSALDGGGVQQHALADLPHGNTRYPLYRRLGGSLGRFGRMRKIAPTPGSDPRTVQPVVSHYMA
jgi:hypothetical protein